MCEIDWAATAAWVQAFGSILAIGAAIWIGERSAKQSRALVESERRRQADIVASTISMKLHLVGVELNKKSTFALEIADQVKNDEISTLDRDALNNLFLINQNNALDQMRANVTLFDRESGILTNTAMDVLDGYNPTVSSSIAMYLFKGSNPSDLIGLCNLAHEQMTYVASLCSEAESRLEVAHGLVSDHTPNYAQCG